MRDDVQDPADVHRDASDALTGPAEPTGQRDVALMARLGRDDMRLDPAADQREVAEDVARLVPHELVGPAERLPDQTVVGEDQGGLQVGTLRQTPGSKRFGLPHEAEGTRPRQLPREHVGGDVVAAGLATDERVRPLDGGRQPEPW